MAGRYKGRLGWHQKRPFLERYQAIRTGGRVDDVEVEIISPGDELHQVSFTATAVMGADGKFLMSRSVLYDITALHKAKSELERIQSDQEAMLDNEFYPALLRGEPYRTQQALAVADRTHTFLAVCYVDLDGFKQLNDSCGHAAGDVVLKEVAHRLQHAMRPNDTACRLGGDEFALLITQFDEDGVYETVLQRALAEIRKPIALDSAADVQVSVSIGVSRYPTDGTDADVLLMKADQAMYQSKHLRHNRICIFGQPHRFV